MGRRVPRFALRGACVHSSVRASRRPTTVLRQADLSPESFVLRNVDQLCRVGTLANIQSVSATPEGLQVCVVAWRVTHHLLEARRVCCRSCCSWATVESA
jgi:hypothetical protein